jgi:hypothetical protein
VRSEGSFREIDDGKCLIGHDLPSSQHRKLKAGFSWEEVGCEAGNILGRVMFGK